ncbi:hypothetical protein CLU95_4350 [Variovorax sp. 54]|uniref:hypothetical protein n=1 Tax=Variovorax sp. 54 TaxID=2035212 RepID=UPI000C191E9F|nr:hypothetical protein [Variovorax sp. 54]PIF77177.1 hypothetical protein CLU95_4350 [Variovorax sp. 54]
MKKLPLVGFVGLLASWLAGSVLAAPAAQVFDAVKMPESSDAPWRARLCALLPQPCTLERLELYRPRGAAPGEHVLLSAQPLAMARVRRTAGADGWQLDRLHDFSAYAQALAKEGSGGTPDVHVSLAPALYPLAEGRWAVAVQQTVTEGYSGGGASFSTADFVPLEGGAAVHTGVPFSCNKMVRACFSEKEYRTSKHCHDESFGSLRIAYGEPTKPGGPYDWQYTWLQTEWPQNEPKSATTTSRIRFTAKTIERAGFCGGPQ